METIVTVNGRTVGKTPKAGRPSARDSASMKPRVDHPLTADRLREVLSYDPETGEFRWSQTRGVNAKAGELAGYTDPKGYLTIRIDDVLYRAHRLAWLYVHGEWPGADIDHEFGNKGDNRIRFLRDVPRRVNLENKRKAQSNNVSCGLLGVTFDKKGCARGRQWIAQIKAEGKRKHLGRFATPEEAHQAYLKAKRELHEGCTI